VPATAPHTVVLLIAHGSRNPAAADDHARLCSEVARRSGVAVEPAYLELSEPSIPGAIDAAVAAGATRIRLVPHFLHLGNHVARDLPAITDDARRRHPGTTVVLEPHVGADPALVGLVAGIVEAGS
jgi:sirohydrochlorin ferrochelatase